jgi:hypothetical protein
VIVELLVRTAAAGVTLFPEAALVSAAARCLLARARHFRDMCPPNRRHCARLLRYSATLPATAACFLPAAFLERARTLPITHPIAFGDAADGTFVTPGAHGGRIDVIVPAGKIMFALADLASVFRVGSVIINAQPAMFSGSGARILRITFPTAAELRHRLTVFACATGDVAAAMLDADVLPRLAGTIIRNAWSGYTARATTRHTAAQIGQAMNWRCFLERATRRRGRGGPPVER